MLIYYIIMLDNINNILSDGFIKYFLLIMTSIFIGYTLQPVPEKLNYLFNNSYLFKFMILFITGILFTHPINCYEIYVIFIISIIILLLFKMLR
jgi:hypothetical protein